MSDVVKSSIKHGLETLGVCILVLGIDVFLKQIAPNLPQTALWAILVPLLGGLAKSLRANPNIAIPDWVNEPVGRARR